MSDRVHAQRDEFDLAEQVDKEHDEDKSARKVPGKQTRSQFLVQRKAATEEAPAPGALEAVVQATAGPGRPLPRHVRVALERVLRRDLSGVRIHTDAAAAEAAARVRANAFTVDQHIFFGEGQFDPESTQGMMLLVHELVHTTEKVQHEGGVAVSRPTDAAEVNAEDAAWTITQSLRGDRRPQERRGAAWPGRRTMTESLVRAPGTEDADSPEPALERAAEEPGQALPSELRHRFETSLGTSLGDVRVHNGPAAAWAAESVGARAYTVGKDIHFNAGEYQPGTPEGDRLVAHEVAHTAQQAGASPAAGHGVRVSQSGDGHEVDADRAAGAMVAGVASRVQPVATGGILVQREDKRPQTYKSGGMAARTAQTTINAALPEIADGLKTGTKRIRLKIVKLNDFAIAWAAYCDRVEKKTGNSVDSRLPEGLNGFFDDTDDPTMGYILETVATIGTIIHESMHQLQSGPFSDTVAVFALGVKEGFTELFTRKTLEIAQYNVARINYPNEVLAAQQLEAVYGADPIAKFYFNGELGPFAGQWQRDGYAIPGDKKLEAWWNAVIRGNWAGAKDAL